MTTVAFAFLAAVALLAQSASAACISNYVSSPLVLPTPCLSSCVSPIISAPIVSAPLVSAPIVPALSSTTIVSNCNSVTDSLVDIMQMLPVCSLLANQLPYSNVVGLPVATPYISAPFYPCGCSCGCNSIIL